MRVSVVLDCIDPDALAGFWATALTYRPVGSPPGYRVLVPADGAPAGPVLSTRTHQPAPPLSTCGGSRSSADVVSASGWSNSPGSGGR